MDATIISSIAENRYNEATMRFLWLLALLIGLYLLYYAITGQYWFKALLALVLVVVAYNKTTRQT